MGLLILYHLLTNKVIIDSSAVEVVELTVELKITKDHVLIKTLISLGLIKTGMTFGHLHIHIHD